MTDLSESIVSTLEEALNTNANGCTIYKQKFFEPTSIGIDTGVFTGEYIFVKNDTPIVAVLYNITYNSLDLYFLKFLNQIDATPSKVYSVGLFDRASLYLTIENVFSKITF